MFHIENFNPIVVNKSNATIKGATIVAGNADGKDNSDGRNDINDFVGYGTAVNIYGDSVTTGGGADANGRWVEQPIQMQLTRQISISPMVDLSQLMV